MTATEDADADIGVAPPRLRDEVLDDRRPHRAGEVVARCRDRDRDAAPPREPLRHIGKERPERRRGADADQDAVDERELPDARRVGGAEKAEREHQRAADNRHHNAEAVGELAVEHAADRKADHRQRIGQRRVGARHAEFRLHGRQRDHERPHADAADRAEHERNGEAQPGVGGFRRVESLAVDARLVLGVHGRRTFVAQPRAVKRRFLPSPLRGGSTREARRGGGRHQELRLLFRQAARGLTSRSIRRRSFRSAASRS